MRADGKGLSMTLPPSDRPTVVVIDDGDPFLGLMRDILESEDDTVVTGSVVGDALTPIRAHRPARVIIDLVMQTQEAGLLVLRAMRPHPDTEHTPVLMLTTNHWFVRERAEEVRKIGAAVLRKPFAVDDPLCCVARPDPRVPLMRVLPGGTHGNRHRGRGHRGPRGRSGTTPRRVDAATIRTASMPIVPMSAPQRFGERSGTSRIVGAQPDSIMHRADPRDFLFCIAMTGVAVDHHPPGRGSVPCGTIRCTPFCSAIAPI